MDRVPEVLLSPKQRAFVLDESRFPLYRGAIRSGKTYAGAVRSIDRRYRYPGTTQIIGGPSWSQLRDGTIRTLLRLINPRCIVKHNETTGQIVLDNGSEFLCRTLDDPNVLRAIEAHDMWIDEIALCPPDAFDVGIARVSLPYADPTFVNSLWGTTTPRGTDFTLDVWGREGKPGGYSVIHSTIYNNRANLPDGLIESLEAQYADTPFFAQELLGEYTAFEGLVYPMFERRKHVQAPPCDLRQCSAVVVGVDWGGIMPTAMVLLGQRASGGIHQYAEYYRSGADLGDIGARLAEWAALAGVKSRALRVACDGSEPVAIATLAGQFGAFAAEKDRATGIKLVAQRLSAHQFTISPECVNTIAEYGEYVWSSRRDAATKVVYRTDTPIDHHADAMDATRYGLMALGQRIEYKPVRLPGGRTVMGR